MKKLKFLLALTVIVFAKANAALPKDYNEFAKQIQNMIWNADTTVYTNQIPDSLKNESAVIISDYTDIEISKKSSLDLAKMLFSYTATSQGYHYNSLFRKVIIINDKAALDNFSTFEFNNIISNKRFLSKENAMNVLGIRVIKPNGNINIVDIDEYKTIINGNDDNNKQQKIAVPNLEIGDIIDYFYYSKSEITNQNISPIYILEDSEYPMLKSSIHIKLDKKLAIQYRSFNGAPNLIKTEDDDNYILDARKDNITMPKPNLFYKPFMQTPYICVVVMNPKMGRDYIIQPSLKEKGISTPDWKTIVLDDIAINWSKIFTIPEQDKIIKSNEPNLKKVEMLYDNCYIHERIIAQRRSNKRFINLLYNSLKEAKIQCYLGITTDDDNEPIDELITCFNTTWFIYLPEEDKYLTYSPSYFNFSYKLPYNLEGRKAIMLKSNIVGTKAINIEAPITLPTSRYEQNVICDENEITINDLTLNIKSTCTAEGFRKDYLQRISLLYDSVFNAIKNKYLKHSSLEEYFSKNIQENVKKKFEDAHKNDEKRISDYIESNYSVKPNKINNYKIIDNGTSFDSNACLYIDYDIDGFVNKTGNNIIVSLGKLYSQQYKISGKERIRNEYVYTFYTRSNKSVFKIAVPEGYTILDESLANITSKNVTNEYGSWIVTSTFDGKTIEITATKSIAQKIVPTNDYDKLLSICDAAAAFNETTIIIRKK